MQYRTFGKLNLKVSALGFGCMRLPILDNAFNKINEPEAVKMIRYAIDKGVNYIDSAYVYHGGMSEAVVGKALKDGYREKVYVATKLPVWSLGSMDEADKILDEQLKRLDTSYIDFYLMHSLNKTTWEKLKKLNVTSWIDKVLKEGKIKHIGFSFHDEFDTFKDIINYYDWDFCQIQYNYMDVDKQAGMRGLKYANEKGLAVVIMEPIRGGKLANPPSEVKSLWDTADIKRKPSDWALQWLWNQKEVSVVLSGMSTMQQVIENVESAGKSGVGTLSGKEQELVIKVKEQYEKLSPVSCTGCRYCMPCPNGVNIPRNFSLYNEARMYNTAEGAKRGYMHMNEGERAPACLECGNCESVCPQKIEIIDKLKEVSKYFDNI